MYLCIASSSEIVNITSAMFDLGTFEESKFLSDSGKSSFFTFLKKTEPYTAFIATMSTTSSFSPACEIRINILSMFSANSSSAALFFSDYLLFSTIKINII